MAKVNEVVGKKKTKISKKKLTTKKIVKASAPVVAEEVLEPQPTPPPAPVSNHQEFPVRISSTLAKKVKLQAEEEGITAAEYLSELITEGVVLRAWEIVERRSHLRDQNSNSANQQRQHNNNNNNNRGGNNRRNDRNSGGRRGSMSNNKYQNIMDDKATFLEYVRNQERQQGR